MKVEIFKTSPINKTVCCCCYTNPNHLREESA